MKKIKEGLFRRGGVNTNNLIIIKPNVTPPPMNILSHQLTIFTKPYTDEETIMVEVVKRSKI